MAPVANAINSNEAINNYVINDTIIQTGDSFLIRHDWLLDWPLSFQR